MSNNVIPEVKVKLAVSEEQVAHNITTNIKTVPRWFDTFFYPNGFEAIIVSAGPSMEKYVEEINLKERMTHPNRTFIVMCVKHALPRLLKMGIEPDFCVILDGRPLTEDSTHGVPRQSLFETLPQKTIFMVASMAHPDYAKYLGDRGARVLGWHTAVTGIEKFNIKEPIIQGGTSSGTRSIAIAQALGIRDITLVGFDSCIGSDRDFPVEKRGLMKENGTPEYIPADLPVKSYQFTAEEIKSLEMVGKSLAEGSDLNFKGEVIKRFWTTGELLAQAQDFEKIFTSGVYDFQFHVLDDGIVNHMFNNCPRPIRGHSFIEYFKNAVPKRNTALPEAREVEIE